MLGTLNRTCLCQESITRVSGDVNFKILGGAPPHQAIEDFSLNLTRFFEGCHMARATGLWISNFDGSKSRLCGMGVGGGSQLCRPSGGSCQAKSL